MTTFVASHVAIVVVVAAAIAWAIRRQEALARAGLRVTYRRRRRA